ncbi:MAG: hypothetical protein ACXWYS_00670 [Gaiellaceae bacterium]
MKLFKTYLVVMAAVAVAVIAVPVAQGGNPTPAQLRALEIRGQAMNGLCADATLTRAGHQALCGTAAAGSRLSTAQLRGLEARGQAMNRLCATKHFASAEASAAVCGDSGLVTTARSVQAGVSGAFHWSDFGIGASAVLELVHYGRDRSNVRPRAAS